MTYTTMTIYINEINKLDWQGFHLTIALSKSTDSTLLAGFWGLFDPTYGV